MNQNYVCTSTSTHVFMWWTECTHTTHSLGGNRDGIMSTIKVHPATDTCNCDHKVLNEKLEKIERFYTRKA